MNAGADRPAAVPPATGPAAPDPAEESAVGEEDPGAALDDVELPPPPPARPD